MGVPAGGPGTAVSVSAPTLPLNSYAINEIAINDTFDPGDISGGGEEFILQVPREPRLVYISAATNVIYVAEP